MVQTGFVVVLVVSVLIGDCLSNSVNDLFLKKKSNINHKHDHDHDHEHNHDHDNEHDHDHDHQLDHDHDHHHDHPTKQQGSSGMVGGEKEGELLGDREGFKFDVGEEQKGEGSETVNNHEHEHDHEHEHSKNKEQRSDPQKKEVYVLETLIATLSISIFPIFIILLVPLGKSANGKNTLNKKWLKVLLSFAVGGLLGDVFLHLLPHAMSSLEHDHHNHDHHNHDNHDHHSHFAQTLVGVQILGGMLLFFLIEKMALLVHSSHGHSHGKEKKESEDVNNINVERLRIAAILNIIADIVHNFTDGMAIAASFMVSPKVGFGTTLAVLVHEIPHEIGDLAILIQTGMSKIQVIKVQFLTAVGALVGALFGLLVGQSESSSWIIPFTAGGFIYLATADVIPQLFEKTDFTQSLKEVLSMIIGVSAMLLITFMEP